MTYDLICARAYFEAIDRTGTSRDRIVRFSCERDKMTFKKLTELATLGIVEFYGQSHDSYWGENYCYDISNIDNIDELFGAETKTIYKTGLVDASGNHIIEDESLTSSHRDSPVNAFKYNNIILKESFVDEVMHFARPLASFKEGERAIILTEDRGWGSVSPNQIGEVVDLCNSEEEATLIFIRQGSWYTSNSSLAISFDELVSRGVICEQEESSSGMELTTFKSEFLLSSPSDFEEGLSITNSTRFLKNRGLLGVLTCLMQSGKIQKLGGI